MPWNARGFLAPVLRRLKYEHLLGCSAPRTYSIICISSESCLGSLVGFARLPCFGTLRSAISAKVALENYYDCVPVLPDEHLSRESRKPTVMIRQELVSCSRGCQIFKDLFRIMPNKMQRAKDRSTDQTLLEPPVRSSEHQGLCRPYSKSYG